MKLVLLFASLLLSMNSIAQEPARHEGYTPLEGLIGSWTIAG